MKHTDSVNSDDSSRLPSDMGHTPTPWKVSHSRYHSYVQTVACDQFGNTDPVCCASKEDAELIVKACNNHQGLVDALRAMLNARNTTEDIAAEKQAREALRSATP